MRILLIDDDPDVGRIVSIWLVAAQPDWEVETVATAAAGLMSLRRTPADLVLLDLGLPDTDGLTLLRTLRLETGVPVIILTAHGKPATLRQALAAGADDFMPKPLDRTVFLERARAVMRRRMMPPSRSRPHVELGDLQIDFQAHPARLDGLPMALSPIQWSLLFHLTGTGGHPIPDRGLLARVWGREYVDHPEFLDVELDRITTLLGDATAGRVCVLRDALGVRLGDGATTLPVS